MEMRLALRAWSVAQMGLRVAYPFLRFCKVLRTLRQHPADWGLLQKSQQIRHRREPLASLDTAGVVAQCDVLCIFRPNPAAYALRLDHSNARDYDLVGALACACDGDFGDVLSSDCVDPSSLAFTSRKW